MKRIFAILFIAITSLILISCSGQDKTDNQSTDNGKETTETPGETAENTENLDPVTLKVAVLWDENMFNERFKNPVEEKFEHITLEHLHVNNFDREALEEMFSGGVNPDFFFTLSQSDMEYFEIDEDITQLLDINNVGTDHLNQALLETIRARDDEGRLISWPYEDTYYVLMYNKDIFDMFGLDYPSDDLTWEELIDLGAQMTQERDGVQYRGLDFREEVMLSQLSVNATDPETGEVNIMYQDEFSDYLKMYKRYFDTLPQNAEGNIFSDERFTQRTTAMLITNAQAMNWWKDDDLNYDIAAVPTWSKHPGIGPRGFLHTVTLNPMSEHKDDVVKIFDYFASEEYQTWMSRNGIGIVSNNKESQGEFYADYESTHGKHIPAIFKNETASPPERISKWDQYVDINLQQFYESAVEPGEFLRIVTEESEAKILEAKSKE